MVAAGGSKMLMVYRSRPLTTSDASVRTAVIMIHGTRRDGHQYYRMLVDAARIAGELPHTLLIAPQFRGNDGRGCNDSAAPQELLWGCDAWKYGDAPARNAPLDSFSALDQLLRLVADRTRFPRLERVVVAGHSAGGQLVQRYAAGASLAVSGVSLRFVVANPSSFMYFSGDRPFPAGDCPIVNRYRYGLDGRRGYLSRLPAEALWQNFMARDVRILASAEDTLADGQLDRSCAAQAQGANRFERAVHFAALHGIQERLVRVPGCGHNAACVYSSEAGREALFGRGSAPSSGSGLK
jgi:pimeloyl-ACP methyl ester carboxylesterase